MKIDHVAIMAKDIEKMKDFYIKYFGGCSGEKYVNSKRGFSSYFITFGDGCRIELMNEISISDSGSISPSESGYVHLAFSTGSKEKVDELTEKLREDGFHIEGEPRMTGDGYYESCILDPEKNKVEITE